MSLFIPNIGYDYRRQNVLTRRVVQRQMREFLRMWNAVPELASNQIGGLNMLDAIRRRDYAALGQLQSLAQHIRCAELSEKAWMIATTIGTNTPFADVLSFRLPQSLTH